MAERPDLLTWDRADLLIETDPIALRDEAIASIAMLAADVLRLGHIVDLACAEHELAFTVAETTLGTPAREWTFKAHRSAYGALRDAVAAEVARRAAL